MRFKHALLALLFSLPALAGPPVIWDGTNATFLTANIDFNRNVGIYTGTWDPSSVATSAPKGSIFLRYGGAATFYQKQDNGSTTNWLPFVTSGSGIITLNGLSGVTQTFAAGTTGSDFNIVSSGSTHTFNFPSASGTNRGLLTSADWTTFNTKVTNAMSVLGDLIYGGALGAPTRLAGNSTTTPEYLKSTGTGAAANAPAWSQVAFSDLSGTATVAQGGTGQVTANAGFNALSPMTTLGDVIYGGSSGAGTRLAGNTSGTKQFMTSTGTGAAANAPVWGTISAGDVPALSYVTSVALSAPAEFTVTGSPVTTSGTLAFAKANQSANLIYGGPNTGAAAAPTFRALVGADLPNPSSSTLGGVQSAASVSHQWINAISTLGVPALSQPAFTDVSGTATNTQGGTGQNSSGWTGIAHVAAGTWSASAVALGGSDVTGTLPIANGGTGQTTANTALNAFLPTQTSNSGKFLKTDGTNTSWATAGGGGGGGGSLIWRELTDAPTPVDENNDTVYAFASGLQQTLWARMKVPHTYVAGNPINLRFTFYSPDNSGTGLMQCQSTLTRTGTDAITSLTNQRTSTNSAVTLGAGTVSIPQQVVCDLSDSSGQVNAVGVSPDDIITVRLRRATDTGTSDLKVAAYAAEVTFQ